MSPLEGPNRFSDGKEGSYGDRDNNIEIAFLYAEISENASYERKVRCSKSPQCSILLMDN